MAYLLDDLRRVGIDEIVFIVGHLRETVETWIKSEYPDLSGHYVPVSYTHLPLPTIYSV